MKVPSKIRHTKKNLLKTASETLCLINCPIVIPRIAGTTAITDQTPSSMVNMPFL